MPVIRTYKVPGAALVDKTVTSEKIASRSIYWGHVKGTVLKYVYIGSVETPVYTGLPTVSAFFLNTWDARGVALTREPSGGTIYLVADTPGSADIYAIE